METKSLQKLRPISVAVAKFNLDAEEDDATVVAPSKVRPVTMIDHVTSKSSSTDDYNDDESLPNPPLKDGKAKAGSVLPRETTSRGTDLLPWHALLNDR